METTNTVDLARMVAELVQTICASTDREPEAADVSLRMRFATGNGLLSKGAFFLEWTCEVSGFEGTGATPEGAVMAVRRLVASCKARVSR